MHILVVFSVSLKDGETPVKEVIEKVYNAVLPFGLSVIQASFHIQSRASPQGCFLFILKGIFLSSLI